MAIREYIGARYVPRFMGTYINTQIYEALDVVDNGLGTSYIAKVPTPAGTPLTNTTYWAIYGATSGAIINLQNQIDVLNSQISMANVIVITDSYGTRTNINNKKVTDILTDWGANLVDVRLVSGGSFAASDPTKKWYNYVDLYTGDASKVSDVIFCGTINDGAFNYSDVVADAISTINKAKTTYPNARIHIFPWGVSMADSYLNDKMRDEIPYAYKEACTATGALFATNAMYILRNSTLLESDLVHPNNSGVDALAEQLNEYINGRVVDVNYTLGCNFSIHAGGSTIATLSSKPFIMKRHNNAVTIESTEESLTALEMTFVTPGSGLLNLGYGLDIDETLISFSSLTERHNYDLQGIGRNTSISNNELSTLRIKPVARYIKMTMIGLNYGGVYDRFMLTQNVLTIND